MIDGLRTRCLHHWGMLGALLLTLTACGGGGGGGGGGGFIPQDPSAGLTSYTLALSLLDADGNSVTTVSPSRTATLRVEVREDNGVAAPVEGAIVNAAAEFALIDPENGSALTDTDGVALFEIAGGSVRGADQVSVTVESPAGTVSQALAFQISDVALRLDARLIDADGLETTFVAPDQPGTLRVTVTEIGEDGSLSVPREPVVISAAAGFATVSPDNGQALTNAEGVASFEIAAADTSGADTVELVATSGSGDEFSEALAFQIFTEDDSFALSLALLDGNGAITREIDAASPGTVRALLTRSNPLLGVDAEVVAGQIVTLGSSDGVITPENGAALTDGTGTATFGVAAGSSLGAQTLSASVNAPGGAVTAELPYQVVADVAGPGFAALFLELELRNEAGQRISSLQRGQTAFLRVRVLGRRDGSQGRELVPGIPISIGTANGLSTPVGGSLLSDDSGEANFIIEAGDNSGTDVLSATVLGPSGPVTEAISYDVSGTVLRFSSVLLDESGLRTTFVAPEQPGRLRVTVRELNPDGSTSVPEAPVVVNASAGLVLIDPDNGAVVTNDNGVAEFTLSAGSLSGADAVALSAQSPSGETFTGSFPLQVFTDEDSFSLSLALLDASGAVTTQIDPGSPGELVALLRRSNPRAGVFNQPVGGQVLELSVTDGAITPENGARVTDAQGEARFGIAAGQSIGAQVATVSVNAPGGLVAADLPYEVVANTPASGFSALFMEVALVDAAGNPVSTALPGQAVFLEARVTGNRAGSQVSVPAAGLPVTLTAQNGAISPGSGNVVTDSQGIARFRVTGATTAGTDVLTATVVGPLGPVVATTSYDVLDADLVLLPVLLDSAGEETSFVSTARPGTLRVQVLERAPGGALGAPAAPVTVSASANLVNISPENGAAITDDAGFATFQLQAGATSGADLVTVATTTAGNDTVSVSLPLQVLTDDDNFELDLTLLGNDGAVTTELDAASPGTLVVLLTRSNSVLGINGEPVPGQVVRAGLSGDGTLTPANGAALTDTVGEARFGITAGSALGAETVTVSVDGPAGTVTRELSYQVVEDVGGGGFVNLFLTLRLLDAGGAETDFLSRQEQGTLEVFVEGRRAGAQTRVPAAGVAVSADVQNGTLLPETGSLLTDASGIARFSISAAGAATGTDVASATVISPAGPISRALAFDVRGAGLLLETQLLDAAGNVTRFISPDSPGTLSVRVLEEDGSGGAPVPLVGQVVSAAAGLAQLTPASGTALTDADGVALFRLDAGTSSGADTVTVATTASGGEVFEDALSYGVYTAEDEFELTLGLFGTGGEVTSQIDAANPGRLVAQLRRSNSVLGISGEPVAGEVVSATLSDGALTPANGRAVTDDEGEAEFAIASGGSLGAQTVTVSVSTPVGTRSATLAYEVVNDIDAIGFVNLFLSLQLVDGNGVPTSSISRGAPAFLEVSVTGQRAGSTVLEQVEGIPVSVNTDSAVVVPGSGTALSGADGIARFTVSAGSVSGTDTLSATVLGPAGAVRETLNVDINAATYNVALQLFDDSGPTSTLVLGASAGLRLDVTVTDSTGAPVAGVIADAGTILGLVTPDNGRALTDTDGVATFRLSPSGQTGADEINVTLTLEDFSTLRSINYEVVRRELVISSLRLLDAQGTPTTTLEPGTPLTLEATVADSDGRPLSGIVVDATPGIAQLEPANGRAVTDDTGVARFTLRAGSVEGAGTAQATVTADGISTSRSVAYQVALGEPQLRLRLLDPQGLPDSTITAQDPLTLEATLTAADGSPLPGVILSAATGGATIAPANGSAITDDAGVARFTLSAGDTVGADTVTVTGTVDTVALSESVAYQVGESPLDLRLQLVDSQGNPSTTVSSTQPLTLIVTLEDDGAPVSGVIVEADTDFALLSPASGRALTDGSGEARFTLTAGASFGADAVTVTVQADASAVVRSASYQVIDRAPPELSLRLVDAQGLPNSTVLPNAPLTLEATLRTAAGDPIADAIVDTLATPALASLTPGNGRALTDGSGVARFTLSAAAGIGADSITLGYSFDGGSVSESLAFQVGEAPLDVDLELLDPQGAPSTVVTAQSPLTLRVTVEDDSGPRAGVLVDAQTGLATLSPANGRALTDAAGVAEFTLSAGAVSGADAVTVTLEAEGATIVRSAGYAVEGEEPTLALELLDAGGTPSRQLLAGEPLTLEATVQAADGTPLEGLVVNASTALATIAGNGSAVTDADGVARFTVEAGSVSGADSIAVSVSAQGVTLNESIAYEVGASPLDMSLSLFNSSGVASSIVRLNDPLTLEVSLELDGQPQSGVIVEASTDTALLAPANGRALTDADGLAQFTLSAGTQSGAGTVEVVTVGDGPVAVRSINYEVLESRFDLQLSVVDGNGEPTTRVTSAQPATLRVQAVSLNVPPEPVSGFVASASGSLVQISPDAGTALTDATGLAEFTLSAGDAAGADLITVSIDTGTAVVTETIGVEVNASEVQLGAFIDGEFAPGEIDFIVSELPFGGNTRFNLAVLDDLGELVAEDNQIRLTSDCAIRGEAGLRALGEEGPGSSVLLVDTVQGLASAEYNALDCVGEDEIRATLVGENKSAAGSLTINPASANYIGFFETFPAEGPETGDRTVIALAGTGSEPARPEIARVTFEVLAARPQDDPALPAPGEAGYLDRDDRIPIANAAVVFSLNNDLAGIQLCDPDAACSAAETLTLQTDQDGLVTVAVQAGSVPAQTFVTASYTNPDTSVTVLAGSNQIVVSTGVPDQNSFSISVADGFYVASAANVDGVERVITARLADRFNNPVPDGTTVVWRTEYGAIDASCETGRVNGARLVEQDPGAVPGRGTCSVLWTSQDPRLPAFLPSSGEEVVLVDGSPINGQPYSCPSHNGAAGPCPDDLGPVRGLRSSILAYSLGDEDFSDSNGDGIYSAGEPFNNCLEEFIDYNENASWTASFFEEFIDLDNDNSYGDSGALNGGAVYNGTLCTAAAEASGICSRELVNVSNRCSLDPALQGRSQAVLTLSSSPANQLSVLERTGDDTVLPGGTTLDLGVSHAIHIADIYNNRPGNGTEVTVEIDDAQACVLFVEGGFIGGDNGASTTLVINDAGDAPGATSLAPIVVTNEDPTDGENDVAGTVLVSVDDAFLTSFRCN